VFGESIKRIVDGTSNTLDTLIISNFGKI
jgi:hypothetical protein